MTRKSVKRSRKVASKDSYASLKDFKKEVIRSRSADGFQNFVSRIGINPNSNNQISQSFYEFNLITRNRIQLEAMYRGAWLVGAMVDSIPEDMCKGGIDITTSSGANKIEELQSAISRLGIWSSLCDTKKWARLYGGAIGVLQIEGQDISTPLRMETIGKKQFKGITVYDRWQLYPDLTRLIQSGPNIGLPEYYYILTAQDILANTPYDKNPDYLMSKVGQAVHYSRCIRQIGIKLPYWQAITEMMWGMSNLERIFDRLISFDNTTLSTANLVNHAHLRMVGVDKLREIMGAGGKAEENLIKQFEYMRLVQSNEGITLIDKEDTYASNAYSFAGLSDVLLQFQQQLAGASETPMVRLFGQSPAGLNSTGESDLRNYYDNINSQQETDFRQPVTKILKVIWQSEFQEEMPEDLQFTFKSLWQLTPDQKATVAKTKSEVIIGAYDSGLVSRQIAVKELRYMSADMNIFTNITDEDINEAEGDLPPMPGSGEVEQNPEIPSVAQDSLYKKFTDILKLKKLLKPSDNKKHKDIQK